MFRLRFVLLAAFIIASSWASSPACLAQTGLWDGSIDSPGGPIRFGLQLDESNGKWSGNLINGTEKIEIPRIESKESGSLVLKIDHYDSQLSIQRVPKTDISKAMLVGSWKKRRGANKWVKMAFSASESLDQKTKPSNDVSKFDGYWKVKFESSEDPAVGIFKSDPKSGAIEGTFLTTTGDYRFLAGSIVDDQLELSCFDGAHAFLFKAKLKDDGSITGDFWSSNTWHETWTATRDKEATLPDGFELTTATKANINALSFPNLDGQQTRLDDERFTASVRIVHIFGSWCPNCHDAAVYLAQLEKKYSDKMSVVGIAFELTGDAKRDADQVRKYLARHKLDHPVLIGGKSSKKIASRAVTVIDEVRSYPTTIFADASGKIIAVHQGFSGPATGEAYEELKKNFESVIEGILNPEK
jgi:thiol-disulfide isomerase/thioredoxin